MKSEYTTKIRVVGNSCCIIVPKMQLDILKAGKDDVVKVSLEKVKN